MNRPQANSFLKSFFAELKTTGAAISTEKLEPFLNFILSLKRNPALSIPLLRELAALITGADCRDKNEGLLCRRINRCYSRLCRVQEELGHLDFRKAVPVLSPEDFVFSQIDFSRYREMDENKFNDLFPESLTDFSEEFFMKNFGFGKKEIESTIAGGYKKSGGCYKIQQESPLILSIMRTLETSLESSDLLTPEEIIAEAKTLLDFTGGKIKGAELLYPALVLNLNNVTILHEDGMTTKLFISAQGDLSGTFRPADKPWTKILILCEKIRQAENRNAS